MGLKTWPSSLLLTVLLGFSSPPTVVFRLDAAGFHFTSDQPSEQKLNEYDGEIQSYEPDNLLTIRKLPRVEVKYDLTKKDTVYSIAPDLQKFSKVRVTERDENGTHYVTVVAKESKH